ncbi:MAG: hypothetical protein SCALA702_32460 [Melioribacteraceae bacterium]|nr:MAG: hypothetical protein SCALA702_32460 [Melioribacteraceae bacterium]
MLPLAHEIRERDLFLRSKWEDKYPLVFPFFVLLVGLKIKQNLHWQPSTLNKSNEKVFNDFIFLLSDYKNYSDEKIEAILEDFFRIFLPQFNIDLFIDESTAIERSSEKETGERELNELIVEPVIKDCLEELNNISLGSYQSLEDEFQVYLQDIFRESESKVPGITDKENSIFLLLVNTFDNENILFQNITQLFSLNDIIFTVKRHNISFSKEIRNTPLLIILLFYFDIEIQAPKSALKDYHIISDLRGNDDIHNKIAHIFGNQNFSDMKQLSLILDYNEKTKNELNYIFDNSNNNISPSHLFAIMENESFVITFSHNHNKRIQLFGYFDNQHFRENIDEHWLGTINLDEIDYKLINFDRLYNIKIRKRLSDLFEIIYPESKIIYASRRGIKKDKIEAKKIVKVTDIIKHEVKTLPTLELNSSNQISSELINYECVLFTIRNRQVYFSRFTPDDNCNEILLEKDINILKYASEKEKQNFFINEVMNKHFANEVNEKIYSTYSTLEILRIIYDMEISYTEDQISSEILNEIDFKKVLNDLRHQTTTKLGAAIRFLTIFNKFIENQNLSDHYLRKEAEEGDSKRKTLSELISDAKSNVRTVRKFLKGTKGLSATKDNANFMKINTKESLEKTTYYRNDDKFKIEITGDENCYINVDVEYFEDIFIQLLDNANKHAFDKTDIEKNIVSIDVSKNNNSVIIDYHNNGRKFSINKDQFIKYGNSNKPKEGVGAGGALINTYAKVLDCKFELKPSDGLNFIFYFKSLGDN